MRALVVLGLLGLLGVVACAEPPVAAPAWTWDLPGGLPAPRVPADNPMSAAKVELGRYLFYDRRLSGNGSQACASCHDQARAFADGRATSIGATGAHGRRNSLGLANVAYRSSLTWADPTARDLEAQARVPMFGTTPVELGLAPDGTALLARLAAEPVYDALFPRAFPDDAAPLSIANVTRALASFERTILSGSSRFDRGELTPAEQRGFALFASPSSAATSATAASTSRPRSTTASSSSTPASPRPPPTPGSRRSPAIRPTPAGSARPRCATSRSPRRTCTTAASRPSRRCSTATRAAAWATARTARPTRARAR